MLEQLKINQSCDKWFVTFSMSHGPCSDQEHTELLCQCNSVCVDPVVAAFGSDDIVTLSAYFDSEEKARSPEIEEAFQQSAEKVRNVFRKRQVCR